MDVKIRLYITDDEGEKFLGIGVLWLLRNVDEYGSIRQAAEKQHMSYTKALRMLNKLEESLGRSVIIRRKGGDTRKGARLTKFGRYLADQYELFHNKVHQDTDKAFADFQRELSEYDRNHPKNES